ncbi:hypothetical protein [Candidatus Babela massiliensis]|uniref:Uncharacterized protein n=1 Tax=Candidatus Babela massiliensis TaxID=673862 RepID=V6DFX4_9BACT|nr:hypothetical protein [Candidatus Babela massiliensis]CDK30477.1 hypothetical protein BABL1_gene_541 [Candidatus Babela massiliensis]
MNMRYILTSLLFFSFTNSLFSMETSSETPTVRSTPRCPTDIRTPEEIVEDLGEGPAKRLFFLMNSKPEDYEPEIQATRFIHTPTGRGMMVAAAVITLGGGYWLYNKFYKIRTPLKKVETDQASQTTQDDIFDFIAENQEPKVPNGVQHRFDNLGFEQLFDKLIATLSNDQWHMYDDMDDKLIRIHGNPLILKDKDFEHFLCALNEEQKAIVELMIEKFTLEKK